MPAVFKGPLLALRYRWTTFLCDIHHLGTLEWLHSHNIALEAAGQLTVRRNYDYF